MPDRAADHSALPEIAIRQVRDRPDHEDVAMLCQELLYWTRERYAHLVWVVERYYTPELWAATIVSLPEIHAPPKGEILLARVDGRPAGCIMMQPIDDETCEMKRLFVADTARDLGLGGHLVRKLMRVAGDRGYRIMQLETGIHHDEAIALYRRLGFHPIDPYHALPEELGPYMVFMQAELTTPRKNQLTALVPTG